jgi:hypothetical protein
MFGLLCKAYTTFAKEVCPLSPIVGIFYRYFLKKILSNVSESGLIEKINSKIKI